MSQSRRPMSIAVLLACLLAVGIPAPASAAAGDLIDEPFTLGPGGFSPQAGGTWQALGGVYDLSAPAQPASTTPGNGNVSVHATALPLAWTMSLRAKVKANASTSNDLSVIFNWRDASNYSYASFSESGTTTIHGVFVVAGGVQTRVADFARAFVADQFASLKLIQAAGRLTVEVDGTQWAAPTHASFDDGGMVGVGSRNDSASFDDVAVVDQSAAPPPPPPPATVNVATAAQLKTALAAPTPGQVIQLADGTYNGYFVANRPATARAPITLRGSRAAILTRGGPSVGTSVYVDGANYWRFEGFTVANALKGFMVDRSHHVTITRVLVRDIGHEGIHLRAGSSDNVVRESNVRRTGRTVAGYGEGIYIGSAVSNWDQFGTGPDRSDRNQILYNSISETTGQSVDVKEGTSNGLVRGNSFDGSAMTGEHFADSWVDVKGNNFLFDRNRGVNALTDGYQTHGDVAGWGQDNRFVGNVSDVNGPGYAFRIHQNGRAVVMCDNIVRGATLGLSNVVCTP